MSSDAKGVVWRFGRSFNKYGILMDDFTISQRKALGIVNVPA
jgi:hypothetical protein